LGEANQEIGREYVVRVVSLFRRAYGFHITETSYEGPEAATVQTENRLVHFDILMKQEKNTDGGLKSTHFYCECKSRKDHSDLMSEFSEFLANVREVLPIVRNRFGENFVFLFVANVSFGVENGDIQSGEVLKKCLNGNNIDAGELITLSQKVRVAVLNDWFLETAGGGAS
jgi:hypothetical protein